jgi:dimethylargininase
MLTAITRQVSPQINRCELSFHERQPIDFEKAVEQHRCYEQLLRELGLRIISLPAESDLPDAVFVEDPVVVVDEVAIVSRMGAPSRQPEAESLAEVLSRYRPLEFLTEPATLDGGDVMRIDHTLFVGLSRRTNREAITQLSNILKPFDYRVKAVELTGCLHLKSACSYIGRETILANRQYVDLEQLKEFQMVDVSNQEPSAANALVVEAAVIMPASFPRTRERLQSRGFHVRAVNVSELQKAESGVTCMSLIFSSV